MLSLKLTVLFLFCCVYAASGKSCSFNMKELETEPVILVSEDGSSYTYLEPQSETPEIEDGSSVLLLCAGKRNKVKDTGNSEREGICKNGKLIDSNDEEFTIEGSQCTSIPTAELRETEESCAGDNGKIFEAGFPYHDDQYVTLFTICYNAENKDLYYTHHTVHGKSIPFSISESKRKAFSAEGMGETTTKINKFYKTASQISRFNTIFGKSQEYVTKKTFIARGHLVPDADGIYRPQQLGTYFYMNAQPQYQACNAGNWLRIETSVRNIAEKLEKDLDVYTGVIGKLQFEDANGNMATAYIDDDEQLPLPKFFFKVVRNVEDRTGLVFISSNDPHDKDSEPFCRDICADVNLSHADFPDHSRGFSFCCTLSEFLEHYDYLPETVTAEKVLSL